MVPASHGCHKDCGTVVVSFFLLGYWILNLYHQVIYPALLLCVLKRQLGRHSLEKSLSVFRPGGAIGSRSPYLFWEKNDQTRKF